MSILQQWAEGQGLELAAECHLVRLSQAGRLILADKTTPDQVRIMIVNQIMLHCIDIIFLRLPICPRFAVT